LFVLLILVELLTITLTFFLKNNISHKVLSLHLDDVRVNDAYIMANSGNMRDICEKYPTI
jgi:hypothetical protein